MFIFNIQRILWNLLMMRISYKLRKTEKVVKSLKILKMSSLIIFKSTLNKLATLGNITLQSSNSNLWNQSVFYGYLKNRREAKMANY